MLHARNGCCVKGQDESMLISYQGYLSVVELLSRLQFSNKYLIYDTFVK